jgi:hypothetical protein
MILAVSCDFYFRRICEQKTDKLNITQISGLINSQQSLLCNSDGVTEPLPNRDTVPSSSVTGDCDGDTNAQREI